MKKFHKKFFTTLHIIPYIFAAAVSASDDNDILLFDTSAELHHSIPYITLRNKTGSEEATDFFGGERDILRTGHCDVSRTQVQALKSIADNVPFYIPEDILQLDAIQESSVDDFWKGLKKEAEGRPPILYVHGFNVDFERGCRRASDFKQSLDLAGRFIFFSWPSDGVIVNYTQDEADLYWSVDPLQEMLSAMVKRFGKGKINIAAHSLGTRGVMLALVRMAKVEHGKKQKHEPLINQIVLIAPDIDAGIFKQYLPHIKPLAKNITIYVSAHDSPLALSTQVHGYPRLGEPGSHLDELDGVEIIEVSDVPVQYPSGHLYHLYNDKVAADLYQLLNRNKVATERGNLKQTGKNYWRLQPARADATAASDKPAVGR